MTDVVMPQMGESIVEGTLTRWLKKVGEKVERDEPLFEISTDKVDTEIPSPAAGVLTEVLVQEGNTVGINTVVARIGDGAAGSAAIPAGGRSSAFARTASRPRHPRSHSRALLRKQSVPDLGPSAQRVLPALRAKPSPRRKKRAKRARSPLSSARWRVSTISTSHK